MPDFAQFTLVYSGGVADRGLLDLYDASQSYYGFSRVLAVLGHYYSTGKIISQAPAADIEIYIGVSSEGSFRQTVLASVVGGIIVAPFTTFVDYTLRSWLPSPDKEMQQVIKLLEEQNRLLRGGKSSPPDRSVGEEEVANHLMKHKNEIDVIRSVTSSSFRQIFRPVGKSVDTVGILAEDDPKPIGIVDEPTLRTIESEVPDLNLVDVSGVVNSFSRSSLTGIIMSREMGRGFRFKYVGASALPRRDIFSWSQYYGKQIRMSGRYVRFFDGTIKRFEVVEAKKDEDE